MSAGLPREHSNGAAASPDTAAAMRFDTALAGKYAECDGGGLTPGGLAAREDFAGTLTGVYLERGDPPTRWYLLANLTARPLDYEDDTVWCERGFLFVEGE